MSTENFPQGKPGQRCWPKSRTVASAKITAQAAASTLSTQNSLGPEWSKPAVGKQSGRSTGRTARLLRLRAHESPRPWWPEASRPVRDSPVNVSGGCLLAVGGLLSVAHYAASGQAASSSRAAMSDPNRGAALRSSVSTASGLRIGRHCDHAGRQARSNLRQQALGNQQTLGLADRAP